jgi:hypothetical protein
MRIVEGKGMIWGVGKREWKGKRRVVVLEVQSEVFDSLGNLAKWSNYS